jgi:hypothetical protein
LPRLHGVNLPTVRTSRLPRLCHDSPVVKGSSNITTEIRLGHVSRYRPDIHRIFTAAASARPRAGSDLRCRKRKSAAKPDGLRCFIFARIVPSIGGFPRFEFAGCETEDSLSWRCSHRLRFRQQHK